MLLAALLLITACGPREQARREIAAHDNLTQMRKAIDKFYEDKGRFPSSLEELVPNYLRKIPVDPLTGKADWVVVTEEPVVANRDFNAAVPQATHRGVVDVRTRAAGVDGRGTKYSEY